MSLDHFVSQVHLKNFYSPVLGARMHAIKKKSLATYICDSESQCRLEEGNTNPFLSEPRFIEDILKFIEPAYNKALEKLRSNSLDVEAVLSIVGFAAYVEGNSPAGMRIHSGPIKASVQATAKIMDKMGKFSAPPSELDGDNLTELLENGGVEIDVDPKYAQSIAVQTFFSRMSMWGNSSWDIILNSHEDSSFFTSDYPIGLELSKTDNQILNRIVPLAPDIAIRILPDLNAPCKSDLEFSNLRTRIVRPTRTEVGYLNQIIVRCAETTVYRRDCEAWVLPFVKKHANFRVEPVTTTITTAEGTLLVSTMRVLSTNQKN